jgi:hypothetical protein
MAHADEVVGRLDRRVDVQATVARCLHEGGEARLLEHQAQLEGGGDRIREVLAGLRVEVEPQLIRMIDVAGARRPRVEHDRVHLRHPDRCRGLVDDEHRMLAAAREGDLGVTHPLRHALGRVLREVLLPADAVGIPLQGDRAIAVRRDERIADRDQVLRVVEFRDAELGPEHARRAGDPHLADAVRTGDLECRRLRCHASTLPGAFGVIPDKLGRQDGPE